MSAGISYDLNREILAFNGKDINADSIGYAHNPAVNLSISQSLAPAIVSGRKDPNVEILSRKICSASYSKDVVEKALLESVTYYYIQARCTNRLLEKYQKAVAFYDLFGKIGNIDFRAEDIRLFMHL